MGLMIGSSSPRACYNCSLFAKLILMMKNRTTVPTLAWSAKNLWRPTPLGLFVLILALIVCGVGEALIIQSQLGAAPWTVLALGVNHFTPFSLGLTTFCISVVVLLLWIPLGLKMGLGTLMNALTIATTLHFILPVLPVAEGLLMQWAYLLGGVILLGVGTCFYLSCHMGGGPRDGLLVGIWQKVGRPIGQVRTVIELLVLGTGFLLGGTVGVGTLVFAFGVGQVMQITFRLLEKSA